MNAEVKVQAMQRSKGEARVALSLDAGRARLIGLRQQGSGKCILPFGVSGPNPEIVFLNTSGGLTGGDSLSYAVALGAGLTATATTQTAERAYRAKDASARVRVSLTVGRNAWLDWLPQETILFDESRLDRHSRIDLAEGAGCIMLETVILGRAAMGETLRAVQLRDWREIWRNGKPVMVEPFVLTDESLRSGAAGLQGLRAFATLALVAPHAPDLLEPLRRVLDETGVEAAASAMQDRLMLRLQAMDGWPLRRQLARALAVLRPGKALPRVWQM